VNLTFGDGGHSIESSTETAPSPTAPARPLLRKPDRPRLTGGCQTPDAHSKVVDAGRDEFRLRFNSQTWTGKIGSPELLSDQKMSNLQTTTPAEGMDYCVWHPADPNLVGRLLSDPPDAGVSCSLGVRDKSSRSAMSVVFDLKTSGDIRLGQLQCYFPRAESVADVSFDRWVSVVGGHLTLEIRR
jgi:hypothetical protein